MRLAIFIALVLAALFVDARLSLNCDKKNTYLYKYRGTASSFGGNSKSKRENEQNTEILADIAVQCHQSYKVQGGKKTNLMSLSFRNVRMHDKLPSKRAGWVKSRGTHEATPVNLDKFFTKPTFAAVNDDGKVTKVFSNENEQVWVRHMKKGVVDMFNTKLRGGKVRLDQSMMGGHKSRYTRVVDRISGTHRVSRKWDQDDFTSPLFNPREATVKAEASVVVKNGTVIMANTVRKAILGVNPRKHKIFRLKKSTIGFHEDTHANMKDVSGSQGTFSDTTAAAAMMLHKVVPFNRAHHAKLHDFFKGVAVDGDEEQSDQFVSMKKAHKIVYSKRPVLKVREGIHASGLNFEQAMEDHMSAAHAQRLKQEINLVEDLVALFKNPEDGAIRSRLSGYVRAHPISSLAALKKTVELAQQHGKKETVKVLQSLLVSIGTDDAQEALLDTLSDAELTHHFLVASIGIQKPSDKVIHHIRGLQKGHASLSDSEDANESLKNLAYLVTADVASRSDNHALRRDIVDEMVDNLNNEEVAQDMLVHLHALGNAKTATPVHYWRRFLSTKGMPEQVHNIILNNLEHRTEHGHDDAEVTRLLHDVVSSKHFHPDVKATAVNVLNKRHRTMGLSSSMYYLASLYKEADEGVQREISDYLHGVGNKRAAYVMSAMTDNVEVADELRDEMREVIMSDVKFFRRVGNFFRRAARSVARAVSGAARRVAQVARRVGHAVGQAARRVGHAVVRAAVAVGKGVVAAAKWIKEAAMKVANAFKRLAQKFGKAQFRGEKTCVPASINAGDQICTYDSEFTQFTQGQGDLSNMKYAKHFEFEKLLGAEVVHLYVGMIGYAGIRFTCDQSEPAAFEFSTFAMAKAYAKIFSKDIKLITAQVSFGKLIDVPARNDAIIKIGGKTLFNRNILPNSVTKFLDYCDSTTKSLIHKSYPELVNVKFAFVIVFVPVEFGFNVQAEFGVDAGMGLCITKQEAYVSIEPYFSVAIAGYGSISIFACKGGLSLRAQLNYRLVPKLGLERCQVCAELRHKVKPITFFVDVFVMVLKKKYSKDLFNFGSKEIDASLFKYCIGPRA